MKKIIYYLRLILFVIYLIINFLLIDKLWSINIFSNIYFLINLIYCFIIILTILSKKELFINDISYNILTIGIYLYITVIFYIVSISSKLDIINNNLYYQNNFIFLIILLLGIIIYTLILNKDEKK